MQISGCSRNPSLVWALAHLTGLFVHLQHRDLPHKGTARLTEEMRMGIEFLALCTEGLFCDDVCEPLC